MTTELSQWKLISAQLKVIQRFQQINEIQEAIILPLTRKHLFEKLNILPTKGVLMYGPSGTSKKLIARACAAETNATFLKLSEIQLE